MEKIFVFLLLSAPVLLFVASPASADPRMETNNNFCHFILDPDDTDNEIFMAGCNSEITVVEAVPTPGSVQAMCDSNYTASGYAMVEKVIPQSAISLAPGSTLTFTSNDSDTPCTMVESNGREYRSSSWQSTIKVKKTTQKGFVTVHYELFCQGGEL